MVLAVAAAHALSIFARKQTDGRRAHTMALVGVVLALGLIVGGISAIGRTPFGTSGTANCAAAHR